MPSSNANAKVKMSLGEFMGGESPANALPTAPRQRGPDDDGSFQRYDRRRDDSQQDRFSRGDADDNWRRGGGGGGGGFDRGSGGGYRGGGGGYNDRDRDGYDRRPMGGGGGADADTGSWRRGGGAPAGRGDQDRGGSSRFDSRGGGGGGGFDSMSRGGGGGGGERPRLQLKARTAPAPEVKKDTPTNNDDETKEDAVSADNKEATKDDNGGDAGKANEEAAEGENVANDDKVDTADSKDEKNDEKTRKVREPEVVNSRAAAFDSVDAPKRESNNKRGDGDRFDRSRGPPPVVNKRFEQLAVEERDRQQDRESRRGPPPVANSRFAAAAAAAEAERPSYNRDDRGPPPVANSRFAAAAEADRSMPRDRDQGFDDRGPPPVANSRFAAAAEADRTYRRDDGFGRDDNRGPPPVANSRFAAAAAMAEEDDSRFRQERNERFGGRNDDPRGPPPIQQNSRFANAVASDPDYMDREARERQDDRGDDRFRGRDEYDDRRGRGFGGDGGYGRGGRGGGFSEQDLPRGPAAGYNDQYDDRGPFRKEEKKSAVADLLKPKARPVEENILKVPTKDQADNVLKVNDNVLKPPKKEEEAAPAKAPAPVPAAPAVDTSAILDEFVSGKRQGDDLATWLKEQPALPSVKSLVFHLLTETEKLNPDVECGWAEPGKYGAALLSLVSDDLLKQMEVLFGIQAYCDKLGMPKLDDEYVVQAMFRAMYKFDLAVDDAFAMWKDDESSEHEAGKLKAVIQTVDWFNWLEEDDDDDEGDEEE
eukprot:CAMPEP_0113455816 /NCGR_PEP_ID=MMETSP0014_2-20120614/8567_1 /TAXON_ID=2857 /ORGANISM="Nitzschia sp." /LENGTH=763 /DNA_ID=CAMNT_0000347251 /DNA_START=125 /DNA_END=2416 /DNA_ORIENTATION=+ /assembly_acc=CAM_ASM_000159